MSIVSRVKISHSSNFFLSRLMMCKGNESDYIILSTVRTMRPGFLKSQNRVNVMLTRCKRRMVIVANKQFIRSTSMKETLLARMCFYWEDKFGKENTWLDAQDIINAATV
jgi:superfamily I DNA and RNA helicase